MNRPETYQIEPFAIQIFGDIANVFYSIKWKSKGEFSQHGRMLESLKKQNGKWLLTSSKGASCKYLPACID